VRDRPTTFDECVATVHAAVAAGINLLDLAPRYGDGKAEEVVGEAFAGHLPAGVRITSKCNHRSISTPWFWA
jgi:aryl-alcohol dehydrogenase-like predicted oxidoreductase